MVPVLDLVVLVTCERYAALAKWNFPPILCHVVVSQQLRSNLNGVLEIFVAKF